jgi:WD40 repeat protein
VQGGVAATRFRFAAPLVLFGAASLAGCGEGGPNRVGGVGGGTDAPLLVGPCDWRGVGQTRDIRFSPDGQAVVAAGGHYLKVFDAATGAHRNASGWQANALSTVIFSRDGKWMAGLPDHNVHTGAASVWRTDDRHQGGLLAAGHDVMTAAFSPDSKLIALLLSDGIAGVTVFHLPDLTIAASLTGNVPSLGEAILDFTPDGAALVLRGPTSSLAWSTTNWTTMPAPSLVASPDLPRTDPKRDDWTASGRHVSVSYDTVNFNSRYWRTPGTDDLSAVAISRDGSMVVAGDQGGHVYVWRVTQAFVDQLTTDVPLLFTFSAQVNTISALAFSADGGQLASVSEDGTLYVFRAQDGAQLWHADGAPIGFANSHLKLLAVDGAAGLILVGRDSVAYVLDATSDVLRGALSGDSPVTDCVGSSDGRATACVAGDRVQIVALDGPRTLTGSSLTGTSQWRGGIALSPDHARLVEAVTPQGQAPTLTPASDLLLWTVAGGSTGTPLTRVDGMVNPLVFSRDGSRLVGVVSSGRPLRFWDASGAQIAEWGVPPPAGFPNIYQVVATSDDGATAAAVGAGTTHVLFADAGSARELPLGGLADGSRSLAVSSDGAMIAIASDYLVTGNGTPVPHGGVVIRTIDDRIVYRFAGATTSIAFLSDTTIVRGEIDQTISYWCVP